MKFYLHTLGCKVNQYESQAIRESLVASGFEESPSRNGAEIFVLNTCTVTDKADKESRYLVNVFRKSNPAAGILVTGCYVEKDAGEFASMPGVTHIVKNSEKHRIADILNSSLSPKPHTRYPENGPAPKITGFKGHSKAFVKIQDGCDNSCAYCKVPLVRGHSVSRRLGDIVEEVAGLVKGGYREIVLTGICLGSWGRDFVPERIANGIGLEGATIVDILKALDSISGDFRIRLSSIEPKYVTDALLDYMRVNGRMCRHLHLPLQSGDDLVLKRMNRPYTRAEYMSIVDRARSAIEDIAITTDIMVGFPGETSAHFRRTLDFVRHLTPARAHIFTFSPRPGTAASGMGGRVDPVEARRRYCELEGAVLNSSYLFARSFVGRTLKVLVEERREGDSGLLAGYSDNYIKVLFPGSDEMKGAIVGVVIKSADPLNTIGFVEEAKSPGYAYA